jgi:hypothetical protein
MAAFYGTLFAMLEHDRGRRDCVPTDPAGIFPFLLEPPSYE